MEGSYTFARVGYLNLPLGWTAAAALPITHGVAAAGEIGGMYRAFHVNNNPNLVHAGERFFFSFHTVSGGPRVGVWRSGRFGATAQILFGGIRFAGDPYSEAGWSEWKSLVQPGGAMTVRLRNRLDFRAAVDFLIVPDADTWTRLSIGMAFKL